MIDFEVEGTRVRVRVECAYPINGVAFEPVIECGSQWAALLLSKHLGDGLQDKILKARRDAYADGWKDAKAKRQRRHPEAFGCHL